MAKKAKKATAKRRARPRPKTGPVRAEMKRLRGELAVIIRDGEDAQGELSSGQLEKAKKTKEALDDALVAVRCIQLHSPY